MVEDAPKLGAAISTGTDSRITPFGALLRRSKLDELPQLLNVLRGEMSFVGPRPEVKEFVELFHDDFNIILENRPGITGVASIAFRNESDLLSDAVNPSEKYVTDILPKKLALEKIYIQKQTFFYDFFLVWQTILNVTLKKKRYPTFD